jgi:hypothetical protein
MIKGIHRKPYIDLSKFIDHRSFTALHPEICRGIALGSKDAAQGSIDVPDDFMNLEVYKNSFKPLYKSYEEFLQLPDSDPVKINGIDFKDNDLSTYLKLSLGAYDLYSFHVLIDFEKGWRETHNIIGEKNSAKYFPGVINWIKDLIKNNVFSYVGRATFFIQEAGGISFEHRDPSVDPEFPEIVSEFIHIRPNVNRPFYIRDTETSEKIYIDSEIAYWNDQDCHGGDPVLIPSYAFRIDGVFTEEFKKKIYEAY